ncbi:MAG: 30S ribosomal protein S14 [Acidobacteria bacterium]|nr:30S ribosomal protein S14 [Acidobacteriota bacterium]MCB9397065.1 30S ribosomal protein S14 [Acidobacteriota bacterium]
MARKAKIAKNLKRMEQADRYYKRRQELVKKMYDPNLSEEERSAARRQFNNIPRDASPTRTRLRCEVTGRSRGNYRRFRMCRITFREMALAGMLPGVTKSSW